jgi:hypothetical protein
METFALQHFGDYSMKKTQVALAAMALVASTAVLADVKISGCMDMAMVNTGTGTVLGGGGDGCASQWRLQASEEVAGMKVGTNLEQGLNLSTGAVANGGPSGAMFNRAANVYAGTETATVTVGIQTNPWINASATGITGAGGNGVFVPMLGILNPNLGAPGQSTGGFFLHGISVSGSSSGVSYSVFSTVEKDSFTAATNTGNASTYTAAVTKDSVVAGNVGFSLGGVNVGLGYESHKNSQTTALTDYNNMVIAANTTVGGVRLNGLYSRQSQAAGSTGGAVYGAGGADQTGWAIGASMPVSDALTVGVTTAKNDATTAISMTAVSANYALSGRSSVYANVASFKNAIFKNNAGSAEGLTAYSDSLLSVGIQHSF